MKRFWPEELSMVRGTPDGQGSPFLAVGVSIQEALTRICGSWASRTLGPLWTSIVFIWIIVSRFAQIGGATNVQNL